VVYLTKVIVFLTLAALFCLSYRILSKRRSVRITEIEVEKKPD